MVALWDERGLEMWRGTDGARVGYETGSVVFGREENERVWIL